MNELLIANRSFLSLKETFYFNLSGNINLKKRFKF